LSTLSEIREAVQLNWPSGYHENDIDNDKVDAWINRIQRRICRRHNFTWMEQEVTQNTTDEERKYLLPVAGDSDWAEVESGTVRRFKSEISCELQDYDSNIITLTKAFKEQIENNSDFDDLTAKGTPSHYCLQQSYLWLYKLPDHGDNDDTAFVIDLEFYGYLADLSGDTDTNTITDNDPEVLECGATALGFRFGLDIERAQSWFTDMAGIFEEMKREDEIKELATIEQGMRPRDGQQLGV